MDIFKLRNFQTRLYILLGVATLAFFLFGSLSVDKSAMQATLLTQESLSLTNSSSQIEALTKMSATFKGNPSGEAIRTTLDTLLLTYKMEITEANYQQLASTLTAIRASSNNDIAEIEIARCMLHSYGRGISRDVIDSAQLCAATLDE